jgi:N-acetylmuramoyl-L-alanine amidase
MSNRKYTKIVVHCSDTPAGADVGAEDIRRWHTLPPPRGRGWRDIGYHYVIRRDGTVELGRDTDRDGSSLDEIGAHAAGHNSSSVGICLVGGKGGFNFTFRQLTQLMQLIEDLREEVPTIEEVVGHRDLNPGKDCPQFDVRSLLKGSI